MTSQRVAWIVGGGSGIGRACALSLGQRGWRIVVSGRRPEILRETVDAIDDGCALGIPLDVQDDGAVASAAREAYEAFGRLDAVIYSAGTNQTLRRWSNMTPDAFDEVVDTNLNGLYRVAHYALPALREKGGSVVAIGSWAGWSFDGRVGAGYSSSKASLSHLVQSLNAEEHVHGIRATLVSPGEVRTEILLRRPVVPTEDQQALMLAPEDVGDAVAWVVEQPARVCVNELVITPVTNFAYEPFGK